MCDYIHLFGGDSSGSGALRESATTTTRILSEGFNEVHRPLMFGDCHLFGGASTGARWCIDGILCFKNKALGSEFGGYTAHHSIGARSVRGAQSEMLNKRIKIAIAVQQ
jgi:hypothetical protein